MHSLWNTVELTGLWRFWNIYVVTFDKNLIFFYVYARKGDFKFFFGWQKKSVWSAIKLQNWLAFCLLQSCWPEGWFVYKLDGVWGKTVRFTAVIWRDLFRVPQKITLSSRNTTPASNLQQSWLESLSNFRIIKALS